MKFVLISGKCRDAKGVLIEAGKEYEAESLKELVAKHPSLANKVKAQGKAPAKALEVATPEEAEVAKKESPKTQGKKTQK